MSSRKTNRRKRVNILKQEIPVNPTSQPQLQATLVQGTISSTPAQLSPEIIAKFEPKHVDILVNSFVTSVNYQNETERKTRELHYNSVNKTETKKHFMQFVTVGASVTSFFGSTLTYVYLKDDYKILIGGVVVASLPYLHNIFASVGNFFKFHLSKSSHSNSTQVKK